MYHLLEIDLDLLKVPRVIALVREENLGDCQGAKPTG